MQQTRLLPLFRSHCASRVTGSRTSCIMSLNTHADVGTARSEVTQRGFTPVLTAHQLCVSAGCNIADSHAALLGSFKVHYV